MIPVEATSTTRADTAHLTDRPKSTGPAADFESVLATAQTSSQQLFESLTRRAAEVGSDARYKDRVAHALSPKGRQDAPRRAEDSRSASEPGRVDRLKSAVEKRADSERPGKPETDPRTKANPKDTDQARSPRNAQSQPTEGSSSKPEHADTQRTDGRFEPNSAVIKSSDPATNQLAEPSQQNTVNSDAGIAASAATSPQQTGAPANNGSVGNDQISAVQIAVGPLGAGSAGGSAGKGADSSNLLPDGAQMSTAKAGDGGGPRGGSTADFQTVLNQIGRVRGNAFKLPAGADSALTVKGNAGGVNLNESESIKELAELVRGNVGSKRSVMILRLDPPELGRMRIDMRMNDQTLTVKFQAETQVGHEALQSRISELRNALADHGIQLDRLEVELKPAVGQLDDPRDAQTSQQQEKSQHNEAEAGGQGHHTDTRHDGASWAENMNQPPGEPSGLEDAGQLETLLPDEPGQVASQTRRAVDLIA